MTNKEAFELLTEYRSWRESKDLFVGELDEAHELAYKALEKQILKKPIFVDTRFRHHGRSIADGTSIAKCYKCPTCDWHIFHVFNSETNCIHCGQALDWSEEST